MITVRLQRLVEILYLCESRVKTKEERSESGGEFSKHVGKQAFEGTNLRSALNTSSGVELAEKNLNLLANGADKGFSGIASREGIDFTARTPMRRLQPEVVGVSKDWCPLRIHIRFVSI